MYNINYKDISWVVWKQNWNTGEKVYQANGKIQGVSKLGVEMLYGKVYMIEQIHNIRFYVEFVKNNQFTAIGNCYVLLLFKIFTFFALSVLFLPSLKWSAK